MNGQQMQGITIVEVGPRDGLQAEASFIPTSVKVELIDRLSACGLTVVEATSFVSPKWTPQFADADDVMLQLKPRAGVAYPVLVPNMAGLDRALAAGARHIAVFVAASDAFNRKNINCDTMTALERIAPVVAKAGASSVAVRAYVSCVLGCPYQGSVAPEDVVGLVTQLVTMGCQEISLGDTIGIGTPAAARALIRACSQAVPVSRLAVHFHDTRGQALANTYVCVEEGVRIVDASVSGLGGCPYADGASGNLATEDLVYMLEGSGFSTGVDLAALCETARWISAHLGREPASKLARLPKTH